MRVIGNGRFKSSTSNKATLWDSSQDGLYDLRHTWATRAAMAGVDLVTLAAMLGHGRVQTVMRYAHPTEEHQFNAMKKLEAYRTAKR
jgi:integrase